MLIIDFSPKESEYGASVSSATSHSFHSTNSISRDLCLPPSTEIYTVRMGLIIIIIDRSSNNNINVQANVSQGSEGYQNDQRFSNYLGSARFQLLLALSYDTYVPPLLTFACW